MYVQKLSEITIIVLGYDILLSCVVKHVIFGEGVMTVLTFFNKTVIKYNFMS